MNPERQSPLPRRAKLPLSRRGRGAALIAILVWAAALRVGGVVGPFGFGWQHLGAFYSLMARNDLRYGLLETRFAQVLNAEPAPREQWIYYTHHPPGMSLATAAVAKVIGERPLAVKLHGLLFSLLQVVLIYLLVAEALSPQAGLAAAFVTAVVPAGAYFATHGSELGPQAISLALLALLLDERARAADAARPRSGATLAALCGSLFFAWPALAVTGFIAARDLLSKNLRRGLLFAAVVPAALLVRLVHLRIATGSFDDGSRISLVAAALSRSPAGAAALVREFDAMPAAHRLVGHVRFLFGDAGIAVALIGAVLLAIAFVRRHRSGGVASSRAWTTAAGLGTLAILYSAPLLQAVLVHRYYLIVALPLVAFLAGFAAHSASHSPIGRFLALTVAAWIGITSSVRVLHDQAGDRTPYYEELGTALGDHVPRGRQIFTTERFSSCLVYYAQREIRGDLSDRDLTAFLAAGSTTLPQSGWFAIVQPSVDPPDAHVAQLLTFLEERWRPATIELPKTGSTLLLFDL